MKSMKHMLDSTHITLSPDKKFVIIGVVNDKKEWVLDTLQDRTAEFLNVLFNYSPVGKVTFLEGDGKTFSILIRDVTKTRKTLEKRKHHSNIIGLNGKPLN